MLQPDVFYEYTMPRTPLGELTALPQSHGWFEGCHFAVGRVGMGRGQGREREERAREGGRGSGGKGS